MAQPSPALNLPRDPDADLAREAARTLSSHLTTAGPLVLRLAGGSSDETIQLPAPAAQLLVRLLDEMAKGNAVTVLPVRAELTTQEAARLLNISRPTLIQLLDQGALPHRRVGTHRRVRFDAVMAYKRRLHDDRKAALAELAAYDQEIGL